MELSISDNDHNYVGHNTDRNGNKFLVYKLNRGFNQRSKQPIHNFPGLTGNRLLDHGTNHRTKVGIQLSNHEIVTMGFCHGRINNYGVFIHKYEKQPNNSWRMVSSKIPKDKEVLKHLQTEYKHSGTSKANFMEGFLQNYKSTNNTIDPYHDWTFSHLDSLSKHYPNCPKASVTQAYLKLAMTAEYHYRNPYTHKPSQLDKKVKAIGVCQAVMDGKNPSVVANFSKHRHVNYLNRVYNYYMHYRVPKLLKGQKLNFNNVIKNGLKHHVIKQVNPFNSSNKLRNYHPPKYHKDGLYRKTQLSMSNAKWINMFHNKVGFQR